MALDERTLGKRLQAARQASGFTQQTLCQAASISYSTLAKIERGAIKAPSIFTVQAIAGAIGVSLDELVGDGSKAGGATRPSHRTASGVRFVYFDLNDTLVRASHLAFARLADESGLPADIIETVFWHYNESLCRGRLSLADFNAKLSERLSLKVDWLATYLECAEPIKPMRELLEWASQYYPVGVFSDTMPGAINGLRERGLLPAIDYATIIDSSQLGVVKPEAEIYKIAQDRAGVTAKEIMLIDDSRANILAAEKQGWHVAAVDGYRVDETAARLKESLQPVD